MQIPHSVYEKIDKVMSKNLFEQVHSDFTDFTVSINTVNNTK